MATIFLFKVARPALSVYLKAYLWLKNLTKSTYYCILYLMFNVFTNREESSLKLVIVWLLYPEIIVLLCFTRLINHLSSDEINKFCPKILAVFLWQCRQSTQRASYGSFCSIAEKNLFLLRVPICAEFRGRKLNLFGSVGANLCQYFLSKSQETRP